LLTNVGATRRTVAVEGVGGTLPRPPDEIGGGIGNAIQGSLILIGLASMVGLPVGVLSGIYLAEYL
jgi:phosphate transport system permease protein